mgnify:CR=1 FL=1
MAAEMLREWLGAVVVGEGQWDGVKETGSRLLKQEQTVVGTIF